MKNKMTVKKAVKEVLLEDPRTQIAKYDWTLCYKTCKKMGYDLNKEWDWNMPSPETITRARRKLFEDREVKRTYFENEHTKVFMPSSPSLIIKHDNFG